MFKLTAALTCLALARAGVINPTAIPISSTLSSINAAAPKTPAPIYETSHEDRRNQDGSHETANYKSISTPYSSIQKYDSSVTSGGALLHTLPTIYSSPIHTPIYYNPATYSVATPYLTHNNPIYAHSGSIPVLTKTYSTPILTKTSTSGISTYHAPIVQDQHLKTTITYSEAPLVSHMSFTGLGANYAW